MTMMIRKWIIEFNQRPDRPLPDLYISKGEKYVAIEQTAEDANPQVLISKIELMLNKLEDE